MKWSIFDPENKKTLADVQQKYNVSAEKLAELKDSLERTKQKLVQRQAEEREEAICALKKAVENTTLHSRRDVLVAFNQNFLKNKVKALMQRGLDVAYVDTVSAKAGATKVYKIEITKSGRIKLFHAIANNPHEAASSGLYTITNVESQRKNTFPRIVKARSHFAKFAGASEFGKPSRARISFDTKIKA